MGRMELSALIGIISAVIIGSLTGFGAKCGVVRDNLVRLHIIANSDSAEDQDLKLAVRDAILENAEDLFAGAGTKTEAEQRISAGLDAVKEIAEGEISSRGYEYPVDVIAVNMYFGTRDYEGFTAPAGRYDAVRVVIGEGRGENWWCVMFPPMCVPAASEKAALPAKSELENLGSGLRYKPKFAVVELIEGVRNRLEGDEDTEWAMESQTSLTKGSEKKNKDK